MWCFVSQCGVLCRKMTIVATQWWFYKLGGLLMWSVVFNHISHLRDVVKHRAVHIVSPNWRFLTQNNDFCAHNNDFWQKCVFFWQRHHKMVTFNPKWWFLWQISDLCREVVIFVTKWRFLTQKVIFNTKVMIFRTKWCFFVTKWPFSAVASRPKPHYTLFTTFEQQDLLQYRSVWCCLWVK